MKITVLDAACGSGKTTKLIDMIAKMPSFEKIIYITPLLSECHRIAGTSFDEDDIYKRPIESVVDEDGSSEYIYDMSHSLSCRRFKHPNNVKGKSKMTDVAYLIENGCNIVSTHSLFANFNLEVIEKLANYGYTLVLDEVISIYEIADDVIKKVELQQLLKSNVLYIDDDHFTLRFNRTNFQHTSDTRYEMLADLCDLGQLLIVDDKIVLWEFPINILKCFKEIYIATYMFEGSQMSAFIKANGLEYEHIKFGRKPSEFKELIDIVDDRRMNFCGIERKSLSHQNICHSKKYNQELRKNLHNFFTNIAKSKKDDRIWTVYKPAVREISGGRYASSWLAFNTKATNEYRDTYAVAYLINLFLNPMVVKILSYKDVSINENQYALSELIQFIYRSRIRSNQSIKLYIPSSRMRELLTRWLNDEFE